MFKLFATGGVGGSATAPKYLRYIRYGYHALDAAAGVGLNLVSSMRGVPGNEGRIDSNTTSKGVRRDARKFWREYPNKHEISPKNQARIAKGRSPVVDKQWIKSHPEHAAYEGQTIEIHHVEGGPIEKVWPTKYHRGPGKMKENHPYLYEE